MRRGTDTGGALIAAAVAAGLIVALGAVAVGALIAQGIASPANALGGVLGDPTVWRAVRFTLWQALLSTVLAVGLGVPVAIALHGWREGLPRRVLVVLFAMPLALPQIVAVLGVVALYGERGAVTGALAAIGLDPGSIYGLSGILLAHVFFNMPLAARIVLGALSVVPIEYERLASQLGMTAWDRLKLVYWPAMRASVAGAASLVFMLCVSSFAVVLVLGGGPRATTLEVALYQALTFDFDIARAVVLTALQLTIAVGAVAIFASIGGSAEAGVGVGVGRGRRAAVSRTHTRIAVVAVPVVAALFVAGPFVAIVARGLGAELGTLIDQSSVRAAITTSLTLGAMSAVLALGLASAMAAGVVAMASQRRFHGSPSLGETVLAQAPALILVFPPIIIASGWFIALRTVTDVYAAAPYLVVTVNAAMAMPFAARMVLPAMLASAERHGRLCAHLGLGGLTRIRLVVWPVLRAPLVAGFVFAFALSLGDLGVIALFGSEQLQTLPYLILQRMGSYRTQDAAGLALILAVMTMVLMLAAEFFARNANAERGGMS